MNNDVNDENTYSLTKLATRTEQEEEGYVAVTACNATFFDEEETRACIFGNTYPQHHTSMDIDDENQYDSITSSHLSAACEVYENLDCSAQANISDDNLSNKEHTLTLMTDSNDLIYNNNSSLSTPETVVISPNCDLYTMPIVVDEPIITNQCNLEEPDQSVPTTIIPSVVVPEYENIDITTTEIVTIEPSSSTSSPLDESIQIHEISSSSKENDAKTSTTSLQSSCESKENDTIDQPIEMRSTLRVTRSTKQQKTNEIPVTTTTTTSRQTKQKRSTNNIQNENIIRTSTRRRTTQNFASILPSQPSEMIVNINQSNCDMDNRQRTLRSKNVINKISPVESSKKVVSTTSKSPLLVTSKTKFKNVNTTNSLVTNKSKVTPKLQTIVAASSSSSPLVVTRWLREKSKSQLQHQQPTTSVNSTKQKPCPSTTNVGLRTSSSALKRPATSLISAATSIIAGKSNRIKNQQTRRK